MAQSSQYDLSDSYIRLSCCSVCAAQPNQITNVWDFGLDSKTRVNRLGHWQHFSMLINQRHEANLISFAQTRHAASRKYWGNQSSSNPMINVPFSFPVVLNEGRQMHLNISFAVCTTEMGHDVTKQANAFLNKPDHVAIRV